MTEQIFNSIFELLECVPKKVEYTDYYPCMYKNLANIQK